MSEIDCTYALDLERQFLRKRGAMLKNGADDFLNKRLCWHEPTNNEEVGGADESVGPQREISIPMIAAELGIRVGDRAGQVGKKDAPTLAIEARLCGRHATA